MPLFIRVPDGSVAAQRTSHIAQPHDIFGLISESCGWLPRGAQAPSALLRELSGEDYSTASSGCSTAPAQRSIRTPGWFLRESQAPGDTLLRELFTKPDDRFEANEVASRCGDVVELLAAELDRFQAAAVGDQLAESAPLAEPLCSQWR